MSDTTMETGGLETGVSTPENGGVAESFVPAEMSEQYQHLQGLNNWEDVHNKLEQLNNDFNMMKGKKGLPSEHTTEEWGQVIEGLPEEARNILGELTAPKIEAPESYEFDKIEIESGTYTQDENEQAIFANAFKNNNIPQDVANTLRKDIIEGQVKYLEKRTDELNQQFDQMATEKWGANAGAKVDAIGAKLAKMYEGTNVSQEQLDAMLDNKMLMPLLIGLDNLYAAQKGDPSVPGLTGGGQGMTDKQYADQYKELMSKSAQGDMEATRKITEIDSNPAISQAINRHLKQYG